jgi:succinate dehydrogenase / fumarate reductase, iron-sulfur subunit
VRINLRIWRQAGPDQPGGLVDYVVDGVNEDMSFLETLDLLNESLVMSDDERGPVAFDHDCREGICGTCGFMIDGVAHGPAKATTTCQLHMRHYRDGDTIILEPWRSAAFPVIKDLVVDRSSFDRIIASGGYISVATGSAPEANLTPVPRPHADEAFTAAACISCGACVAACPNGAAQLFTAAKLTHLNVLPQGQPERYERTVSMVQAMEAEGFGNCTNHGECEAVCPKEIPLGTIAKLNRDYIRASLRSPAKT